VAADPWLDRWPLVLGDVVVGRGDGGAWHVVDRDGATLPLDPVVGDPWRLVAVAGGAPATITGEWSPTGLRPLSVFADGRLEPA
jgi:hypothetical protein